MKLRDFCESSIKELIEKEINYFQRGTSLFFVIAKIRESDGTFLGI